MSAFLNDTDARNYLVRVIFNREIGREPSALEQAARAQQMATQGADAVLAAIRDSPEAATFRKLRGW